MNIPQSAIEPFGVIGIPRLSLAHNIHQTLKRLYSESHVTGSSVYYAAKRFEHLIAEEIRDFKMGLESITIESTNHITDSHGALVGRKYTIKYRIPNSVGECSQVFVFGWRET